ncbi:heme-binding protein [Seongchinamella unica]|uniref:Heme-binding protein n=1 Tax=Seongchinamella unica TaxID=2547392 RepID=A0A4R5LT00_9GAMM|nr:heme-binding protein [Seongchinamella unica]TDG14059.1 heme-binding protein [Seongchinamella unica]
MNEIDDEQARGLLDKAQSRASELGVAVCIAVVDAGGHLKAFHRMDGAIRGAIDVAQRKARTAVLFPMETGDFGKLIVDENLGSMELSNGGLAVFHGGVPLFDGDELIGAVGVSGATAEQDRDIARATA